MMKANSVLRQKGFRMAIVSLVCFVMCTIMIIPALASETISPKVVRIGYFENEVFQEGADPNAVKNGYAYEYYHKIAEYTGWKYEYVYDSFSNLYQNLLDGKVDLLAGLAWNEDRAAIIAYPDSPMGSETYSLVKHDNDPEVTADPGSISGKKIGVLNSAMLNVLNAWLQQKSVSAEVITYEDYTDLFSAFDKGSIDILAAEGDGAYGREHAEVLCSFGSSNYYLCVSIQRPDLLEELNLAQSQLSIEEPNFMNSLHSKYYPVSVSSRAFSAIENTWLEKHETLKIGYLNDYLPYSDTDSDGNPDGIVKDIIPTMLFSLGINRLTVSYQGYNSYDEMLAAVNNGEVDAVFPVGGGLYYSEESGIHQTDPVISVPSDLVYKGTYEENSAMRFAVNQKNRMQFYYVRTVFPNAIIDEYPSTGACLEAVISGKADATTLNGLRVSPILKNAKYRSLSIHQLSRNDDRCFGVRIGNEGLLRLFNRSLNVINPDYPQSLSSRYEEKLYSPSFWDTLWSGIGVFGIIAVIEAVVIVLLLINRFGKNSKAKKNKETA